MYPYEYYLHVGSEIRKIQNINRFVYRENLSNDRYPYFDIPTIRKGIPFTNESAFSFYGCNIGENVAFAPWMDNHISAFNTFTNRIVVSFGFSGCYMAKYSLGGRCYVSHIQSGIGDCKHYWNNLCLQNRATIKIHATFRPTNIRDDIYYFKQSQLARNIKCTIAGVIMPDNRCYAVLVNVKNHLPIYIEEITRKIPFLIPNEP